MARSATTRLSLVLLLGPLSACGGDSRAPNLDSAIANSPSTVQEQEKGGQEPYLTGP